MTMDARTELLTYMGVATVTVVALFGLQMWYASYLDVAVVHARSNAPLNPAVVAHHEEEQKKLSSGPMPIDKAKQLLAERGRTAFPTIAAVGSTDLSAMSGWMHRPGFKPYEPRKQPAAAVAPVPVEAQPAAAPGQVAAAPAQAAPAPAAPPAKPNRAPRVAPAAHP
jgi:hypothetical protein